MSWIDRLFRRNSLENPSVSLQDPSGWEESGLISSGASGKPAPYGALSYPPVWRCLNLIARTVGKLPLVVYRQVGDMREKAIDHPAYAVLRRPNAIVSPFRFKSVLTFHAAYWGNGYAAIFRDSRGRPTDLLPLPPTLQFERRAGDIWYYLELPGRPGKWIPSADVLHITGFSFDGIAGLSVIDLFRQAFDSGMNAQQFRTKFWKSGAKSSGILMLPRGLSAEAQRQRENDWNDRRNKLDDAFKTTVLEEGARWIPDSVTPNDGQHVASAQFDAVQVASIFCAPPHKIGDNSKSSYNSLEQENQAFLDETIDPWLVTWEEELTSKLLTSDEQAGEATFIEFNRDAMLRVDKRTETESIVQELNNGLLTPDEARRIRNRSPYPDGIGRAPRMPANLTILTSATNSSATNNKAMLTSSDAAQRANRQRNGLRQLIAERVQRLDAIYRKTQDDAGHKRRLGEAIQPIVCIADCLSDRPTTIPIRELSRICDEWDAERTVDEETDRLLGELWPENT
jgi:HK97 family phage portal protein